MTLKFDGSPWKTTGHLFYATSSCVHHFVAIDEFKLELQSGNAQSGSNSTIFFYLCDLDLWPLTLTFCMDVTFVMTSENFVMIWWWEHSQKGVTDGQTDGQTDWTIHRAAWSQLKIYSSFGYVIWSSASSGQATRGARICETGLFQEINSLKIWSPWNFTGASTLLKFWGFQDLL